MSEEINNFERKCGLVAGGPASDLKDVLVRPVISIFQAGRESGDRLILQRRAPTMSGQSQGEVIGLCF